MNGVASWLLLMIAAVHLAHCCPASNKNSEGLKAAAEEQFSGGDMDAALLCLNELLLLEV